jgi:hypothetical protein
LYVPSLVVFDHASVAQGPHADQLTEFRQRPKQTVPSDQAPRGRSSCSARQTGMSRSCHFRSPNPTISMQPLYAVQRPVRVSDQAKRIENPTWRTRCVLFTCSVSVEDTGGYERHTFTAPITFQPGMRGTRKKALMAADARHVVAGRLQSLHNCWTVLPSTVILCHV